MQIIQKGLQADMKEIKDYMANTCKLSKEDQSALIFDSYVVKTKSSGIKDFILLQRMNAAYSATKDEKKSHLIYHFRFMILLKVALQFQFKRWVSIRGCRKQGKGHLSP